MKKDKCIIIHKIKNYILCKIFKGNYKYNYQLDLLDRLDNLDNFQEIILAAKESNFYIKKSSEGLTLSKNKYKLVTKEGKCLSSYIYKNKQVKKDSILLFFDRIDKAGDNGFLMYNYFKEMGHKNCYFVIGHCKDFGHIENPLLYGSKKFETLYKKCDFIITSSCDNVILNYKGMRFNKNICNFTSKVIFLQHGVINNDLSKWLITKRFDKMVISTKNESEITSKAFISDSRILKCGLPRFDKLINLKDDIVLVAPTFRNYESESYIGKWNDFLSDEKFLNLYKDKRIVLIAHPKTDKNLFNLDIEIYSSNEIEYSDFINRCCLFLTDYSSIFMDVLFLKKKVLFYNFDQDEFFKNHTSTMFFDYDNNNYAHSFKSVEEFISKRNLVCDVYEDFYYQSDFTKRLYNQIISSDF